MPFIPGKGFRDKYGNDRTYRGGRKPIVHLAVTNKELCDFFSITPMTLHRWIDSGKLDPTSLEKIYTLRQSRYKTPGESLLSS